MLRAHMPGTAKRPPLAGAGPGGESGDRSSRTRRTGLNVGLGAFSVAKALPRLLYGTESTSSTPADVPLQTLPQPRRSTRPVTGLSPPGGRGDAAAASPAGSGAGLEETCGRAAAAALGRLPSISAASASMPAAVRACCPDTAFSDGCS
eukprot:366130-Chlamydomonas_euryale.AAC.67